jgi:hypothetical protein
MPGKHHHPGETGTACIQCANLRRRGSDPGGVYRTPFRSRTARGWHLLFFHSALVYNHMFCWSFYPKGGGGFWGNSVRFSFLWIYGGNPARPGANQLNCA